MLQEIVSSAGWSLAGWTMLHFLWVGSLITVFVGLLRLLLRGHAPITRYTFLLVGFGLLVAALPAIAFVLTPGFRPHNVAADVHLSSGERVPRSPSADAPAVSFTAEELLPDETQAVADSRNPTNGDSSTSIRPRTAAAGQLASWIGILSKIVRYLPWIWIMGMPLTCGVLLSGLIGSERLRKQSRILRDGAIVESVLRLAYSIHVGQRVAVAICNRATTPILVGITRPLILLPPAVMTSWTPEEIEMVLIHELAHVRRWDNLVNLLQRCCESALFFHPGVWWVSHWIREEREHCCDAIVLAQTGTPSAYAQTLVRLAANPRLDRQLPLAAMTMVRSPLSSRVRRILKLEEEPMRVSRSTLSVVAILLLSSLTAFACYRPDAGRAQDSQTTTRTRNEEPEVDPDELPTSPLFPSLEEQKAADLTFKTIGLDLEPLTDEELQRVKALSFEGGLRIANADQAPMGFGGGGFGGGGYGGGRRGVGYPPQFTPGDLLVGLHVWSTTKLSDVAKILSRDDIHELTPLKYYVVRRIPVPQSRRRRGGEDGGEDSGDFGPRGEIETMAEDRLVTGRIAVPPPSAPLQSSEPVPPGRSAGRGFDDESNADMFRQRVEPRSRPSPRAQPEPMPAARGEYGPVETSEDLGSPLPSISAPTYVPGASANHELLYENKNFQFWRDVLRKELSSKQRMEALSAIAEFGAAGKGREAVEAILEVMEHYNWDDAVIGNPESVRLSCIESMRRIPKSEWKKPLLERLDHGELNCLQFARYLVIHMPDRDRRDVVTSVLNVLEHLETNESLPVRKAALELLIWTNPEMDDARVLRFVNDALGSDQQEISDEAFNALCGYYEQHGGCPKVPVLLEILLSREPEIRRRGRQVLVNISVDEISNIEAQLLQVLQEPQRTDDHLPAIRALAALGKRLATAIPVLKQTIEQSDARELQVAAAYALLKAEENGTELLMKRWKENNSARISRAFRTESRQ